MELSKLKIAALRSCLVERHQLPWVLGTAIDYALDIKSQNRVCNWDLIEDLIEEGLYDNHFMGRRQIARITEKGREVLNNVE